MVFFTCNACGEALKKGQVEKHVNICRNCQCLSCMDCGKDFWDDDYKSHVKCLSEDQKYGGKNYEAKMPKGDVKQQEWTQKIHEIIKETNINVKVRDILQQMYAYDNIPRKKRKFQNWMANSLKIHNATLQDQVWDIFSEATRKETLETESVKNVIMPVASENNITKTDEKPKEEKSKKELKEKESIRKLKAQQENLECLKSEKSQRDVLEEGGIKMAQSLKKKKTKEGAAGLVKVPREGNGPEAEAAEALCGKKRKNSSTKGPEEAFSTSFLIVKAPLGSCSKIHLSSSIEPLLGKESETDESPIPTKITNCFEVEDKHQGKFNWKGTIRAVLKQAPNNELSIKKLRKKVIAQYYAVTSGHQKSEEEALALFKKKVSSNPNFRVLKEKVKLLK